MTLIVSISDFRQHISDYIARANKGQKVILKDEKKEQLIAELVGKKTFNPVAFGEALKAASGVFAAENHPEWRTAKDVTAWVEKERKASDRTF